MTTDSTVKEQYPQLYRSQIIRAGKDFLMPPTIAIVVKMPSKHYFLFSRIVCKVQGKNF